VRRLAVGGGRLAVAVRALALFISGFLLIFIAACSSSQKNANVRVNAPVPTPVASAASVPQNGDYQGRAKITRIDVKGGSVELDHETIPSAVPAMKKEYLVSDRAMLNGLKLGDEVNFTLRYNNGQATITAISRQK
jgi:Cu(I)/Ag(I) efflux system protein CusF